MATIVTRSGKGSPLTNAEVDGNFTNLNTELGTKANTSSLATVATSGAYSDLTGKPTNVSSFSNDSGYITGITSGNVTTALGFTPYDATNPASYITSAGSISGNAATATNISNTGTVTLASATESNSIYATAPSYGADQPTKLLNFDWYSNVFSLGNIRSTSTDSNGFGVYYTATGGSRAELARFLPNGNFGIGTVTAPERLTIAGNIRIGNAGEPNVYNMNIVGRSPAAGTIDWDFKTNDATYGARTPMTISATGSVVANFDVRAPIFYDSNNTGYYVDAASNSALYQLTTGVGINLSGGIALVASGATLANSIGARLTESYGPVWNLGDGATWHHQVINGSMLCGFSALGTNWGSGNIIANGYLRGTLFYDQSDTAYYVDPNSLSNLVTIHATKTAANNTPSIQVRGGYAGYPRIQTYGLDNDPNAWMGLGTDMAGGPYEHSIYFPNGSFGTQGNGRLSIGDYNGTTYNPRLWVYPTYTQINNSTRSPLFYDSDNTGYYVDPNGVTRINKLTAGERSLVGYSTISMSGLDADTWYPVTIPVPVARQTTLRIENALNSNAPSWSTHPSGFSVYIEWTTNGLGWGTIGISRRVTDWREQFATVQIVGGITQLGNGSTEVIWLRGGANYFFSADCDVTPTVRTTLYDLLGQTVEPRSTVFNDPWATAVGKMSYGTFQANERVTAATDIRAPIFYDSDNTAYYMDLTGSTSINAGGSILASGNLTLNNGANRYVRIGSATNYSYDLQTTGDDFQIIEAGVTPRLTIKYPNGNLGLGNVNPQSRFTIGSAQGNSLEFTYSSDNAYRNIIANYWNSGADTRMDFNIGRTANVAPVTVMSVGYNSNVGVGTTEPAGRLHTVSTSAFTAPNLLCTDTVSNFRIVFNTGAYAGVPANKPWLHSYDDIYIGSDANVTTRFMSGGATNLAVASTGIVTAATAFNAPVFNDSVNSAYYIDPKDGSNLGGTVQISGGTTMSGGWNRALYLASNFPVIVMNSYNAKYSGIGVDYSEAQSGMVFWVNGNSADITNGSATAALRINTNNFVQAAGSFRAPIFYDIDDSNRFLDPSSTSVLTTVEAYNGSGFRTFAAGSASISSQLYFANASNTRAWNWQLDESSNAALWSYNGSAWAKRMGVTNDSELFLRNSSGSDVSLAYPSTFGYASSYKTMILGNQSLTTVCIGVSPASNPSGSFNGGGLGLEVMFRNGVTFITPNSANNGYHFPLSLADGYIANSTSMRSTIFYDQNDTSYFLDPNSTSVLSTARLGQIQFPSGTQALNFTDPSYMYLRSPDGGIRVYLGGADPANYYDNTTHFFRTRGGSNMAYVDSSGVYAPNFYDIDNTAYYINPNAGSNVFGEFAVNQNGLGGIRLISNTGNQSLWIRAGYDGAPTPSVSATNVQFQASGSSGGSFTFYSGNTLALTINGDYAQGGGSLRAPIFYDSNNTGYYLDPNSGSRTGMINADNLRTQNNVYIDQQYGSSLVGAYNSVRYQGVYAMGDAYKLAIDGTTAGNLYGIAWAHPNAGGVATNLNTHGALFLENGGFLAAISGSIRSRDDMRAPIFYDSNDTAFYMNPNGGSRFQTIDVNDTIYSNNWFRSYGDNGWYSQTHGGGIFMQDATWVRVYNGKAFYVSNEIAATGNITAYYSDERLKTKTGGIDNALEKLSGLSGFLYVENDLARSLGYSNEKQQVGLSAQAVQAVLPEAVSLAPVDFETLEDGTIVSKSGENYLTVDYSRLVPLLIEAIKELRHEVEMLKK